MNCTHCKEDLTKQTYVQELSQGELCLTCFNFWQDEQLQNSGVLFNTIEEAEAKLNNN
jgi:hypothetical protein